MQEEDKDNGCFIIVDDDGGTVRAAAATVLFKKMAPSITIPRPNNNIELAHKLILTTTPFLNVSFLYFSKTLAVVSSLSFTFFRGVFVLRTFSKCLVLSSEEDISALSIPPDFSVDVPELRNLDKSS